MTDKLADSVSGKLLVKDRHGLDGLDSSTQQNHLFGVTVGQFKDLKLGKISNFFDRSTCRASMMPIVDFGFSRVAGLWSRETEVSLKSTNKTLIYYAKINFLSVITGFT